MARSRRSPWDQYVADVLEGLVVVGHLVRLAVERHVRDLDDGDDRGLRFDPEAAQRAIDFFEYLKHSIGEWEGQTIELSPWQQFIMASVFGWMRADGTRRFRVAYEEVARKNGKSTMLAGVGLYLMVADGEPGAEVYTAATKRDQARIVHLEAVRMVNASPELLELIQPCQNNLNIPGTASKYEPLGADSDTMDGLNIHGAIVDELHAHKTRDMWDVLQTATGARRQPIMFAITTAGTDRESICYELHEHAVQVLEGAVQDDAFFAYIATLDKGDDWQDPDVWIKANPNLGISVKEESLFEECTRSKSIPSSQNVFRRFRLNQWMSPVTRWILPEKWEACTGELLYLELAERLRGRKCYGGLDLANSVDIAAFVMVFIPEKPDDPIDVLSTFWMPQDVALDAEKIRRDRVPYDTWVDDKWVNATEGNIIDYGCVRRDIEDLRDKYEIEQIGYDPWNATELALKMEDEGFTMVPIRQGVISLNEPTKNLSKLVVAGKLRHGGHPVMRWMANNLIVRTDSNGNVKPDREKSRQKIDGMAALIMALDRALRNEGSPHTSVYEERGVLVL